jgi:hypothetical protein
MSQKDVKNILVVVGLLCEFIHSHKDNYVLFKGEAKKLVHYPKCGEP